MAMVNISETQQNKAIDAVARLRVAHSSISGTDMAIALPNFKPTAPEAAPLRQAIGLLVAAVASGDATTIAAQKQAFQKYIAPLLEAELIRTGCYPKMTDSKRNAWFEQHSPNYVPQPVDGREEAWLAEAIAAFTHAALNATEQSVANARDSTPSWAR